MAEDLDARSMPAARSVDGNVERLGKMLARIYARSPTEAVVEEEILAEFFPGEGASASEFCRLHRAAIQLAESARNLNRFLPGMDREQSVLDSGAEAARERIRAFEALKNEVLANNSLRVFGYSVGRPVSAGEILPSLGRLRAGRAVLLLNDGYLRFFSRVRMASILGLEQLMLDSRTLQGEIQEVNRRGVVRKRFSVGEQRESHSPSLVRELALYGVVYRFIRPPFGSLPDGESFAGDGEPGMTDTHELQLASLIAEALTRGEDMGGEVCFPRIAMSAADGEAVADSWSTRKVDVRSVLRAGETLLGMLRVFLTKNSVSPGKSKSLAASTEKTLRRLGGELEEIVYARAKDRLVVLLSDLLGREQPWGREEDRWSTIEALVSIFAGKSGRGGDPERRGKHQVGAAYAREAAFVTPRNRRRSKS